jgi:transposase-like protein
VAGFLAQKVEGSKRQRRSIAKKRKIVEQTMQPGASVARVAQQHGVNATSGKLRVSPAANHQCNPVPDFT